MLYKILLVVLLLFLSACQQENTTMPKDINITYQTGPTQVERAPLEYITISPSGENWLYTQGRKYRFISKDGELKTKDVPFFSKILTKAQVQKIFSKLIKHKFYDMKPLYNDPQIMDGLLRSLTVRSQNVEKHVNVIEVIQKDFDAIVKSIKNIE